MSFLMDDDFGFEFPSLVIFNFFLNIYKEDRSILVTHSRSEITQSFIKKNLESLKI